MKLATRPKNLSGIPQSLRAKHESRSEAWGGLRRPRRRGVANSHQGQGEFLSPRESSYDERRTQDISGEGGSRCPSGLRRRPRPQRGARSMRSFIEDEASGEGGSRTRGWLLTNARLASGYLRPLGHLS